MNKKEEKKEITEFLAKLSKISEEHGFALSGNIFVEDFEKGFKGDYTIAYGYATGTYSAIDENNNIFPSTQERIALSQEIDEELSQ